MPRDGLGLGAALRRLADGLVAAQAFTWTTCQPVARGDPDVMPSP
ncbi:MAG TPA: hypothetical protein VMF13_19755 [Luteitalea sp.]|nr:hypothetical protein [Luteitalea sp.]